MKQTRLFTSTKNHWWYLLALFTLVGIILTTLDAFVSGLNGFQRGFKTYLHFTFQANLMTLITAILIILGYNSIHLERFKMLALVAIIIAGLVFWTLILPKRGIGQYQIFSIVGTSFVHGINPLLAVVAFSIDYKKKNFRYVLEKYITTVLLMVYPVLWLAMATVVYYTMDYAIYSFLDASKTAFWKRLIYILGISALFIGFSNILIYLHNKAVASKKSLGEH